MTANAERQADLLAAYAAALAHDDAASPPAELEPALADTARRLQRCLEPVEPQPAFVAALEEQLRAVAAHARLTGAQRLLVQEGGWGRAVSSRRWSLLLLAALLALVMAGTAVASGSLLHLQRPEQRPIGRSTVMAFAGAVPWILCQPVAFQPLDPARVAPLTGRPIAYLPRPPASLDAPPEVSLIGTPGAWPQPGAIAWGAPCRRPLPGRRPYPDHRTGRALPRHGAADDPRRERTVHLSDERRGYASTYPEWSVPNTVAFAADRYIITVASDLPTASVEQLAAAVLVVPAATGPTADATTAIHPAQVAPNAGGARGDRDRPA
ncbi:MAG: hypothetical protein ACR2JY_23610 [Chloroflexota bacterium]